MGLPNGGKRKKKGKSEKERRKRLLNPAKFTTPYNEREEIDAHAGIAAMRHYTRKMGEFIGRDLIEPVADVGHLNPKSDQWMRQLGVNIWQIGTGIPDWDRERIGEYYLGRQWGTILLIDTLEHLLNPLFVLDGLRELLQPGGLLYVGLPQRPMGLWTEHHWHEIEPSRCRYLFERAGFEIEDQKRLSFWRWKPGIKPLIRYFYDYSTIYRLRKR